MASKQGEKSEQDMLEQLEVAKKDLMRALELLNQPVETAVSVPQSPARSGSPRRSVSPVGKASAAGVAPSSVPVVPTEGIDREALIIQVRGCVQFLLSECIASGSSSCSGTRSGESETCPAGAR